MYSRYLLPPSEIPSHRMRTVARAIKAREMMSPASMLLEQWRDILSMLFGGAR